jgi:hypothetical protein
MTSRLSDEGETPESLGLPPWAFANLAGALVYAAPWLLAQIFTGEW